MPPTPVRLTRRTLEGGPSAPSNVFSVLTQGHAVTSGRRDRSSSSLSTLCDHPHRCCTTPGTVATDAVGARGDKTSPRRPLCHVRGPVNDTLEPAHYSGRMTNRYAATLEAAPVRAQDAPRRLNRSRIRRDGRQLRGTARHTSTRRGIVRHACKLLPPWPIKGGAVPSRGDTRRRTAVTLTLSAFSTILALASINTSGTWRPGLLSHLACSHPSTSTTVRSNTVPRAHHCWTYGPDRNQDKPSVLSC
jgi:hypothetical protein